MAFYSDLNYIKPTKGSLLEDLDDIYQAIYTILSTKKGQRVFRPEWGGDMSMYLFEPCDDLTATSMLYDIKSALKDEVRFSLNTNKSYVKADPVNKLFNISLNFDIPGFSDYEQTITLTFKQ